MIGVIDYGVGNLFSLCSSLRCVGAEVQVSADPAVLEQADKLVLPGVGAFGDAADKLRATGLDQLVIRQAKRACRCWASAWACSCSLRRVWNTAATRGWVFWPGGWCPWREPSRKS